MIKVSPSVLAADFANLGSEAKRAEEAGADLLHLDVMDGVFVPNISFGAKVIQSIRGYTRLPFDVHLMITDPARYIEDFVKAAPTLSQYITRAATTRSRYLNRYAPPESKPRFR